MTPASTFSVALRVKQTQVSNDLAASKLVDRVLSEVPPAPCWQPGAIIELLHSFVTLEDLERQVAPSGPQASVALQFLLQRLSGEQLVEFATAPENAIATLRPMSPNFVLHLAAIDDNALYRLSRFAFLRTSPDGSFLVETPRGFASITLAATQAMQCMLLLAKGCNLQQLVACGSSRQQLGALIQLLLMGSFVERGENGSYPEDKDPTLRQWDFHDLLFHSRSRMGRQGGPMGGNFRFQNQLMPQPAVKPNPWRGTAIRLLVPDLRQTIRNDPPFTLVSESRRSIRQYGLPLSLGQLGEFLYRVGRIRRRVVTEVGEFTNRPYPSGGASYELEIYITANRCADLERGFYYYDPNDHMICHISRPNEDMEMLLHEAWLSSAQTCIPQVLFTISARFQRVSWKYSGIAYATQLKNVGALYGTMYLVATAMNLAPCAFGLGNPERFCRLAHTSYYEEGSIGEFALGTCGPES
jgi:SagB-type dehydrogenase family enzyme